MAPVKITPFKVMAIVFGGILLMGVITLIAPPPLEVDELRTFPTTRIAPKSMKYVNEYVAQPFTSEDVNVGHAIVIQAGESVRVKGFADGNSWAKWVKIVRMDRPLDDDSWAWVERDWLSK